MIRKTNPKKLKELRANFSQKELSELLKIKISRLKALESGRAELKDSDIASYVKQFNVKEEDLFEFEKRKTQLIAISSIKGGVGKTSISANLGYSLTEKGKKVLLVDTDSQMNLVQHYGIINNIELEDGQIIEEFVNPNKNFYKAFSNDLSALEMITSTGRDNLDIIISDPQLSFMDTELSIKSFGKEMLSSMIKELKDSGLYDFVIFDTSINLANFNTTILKNMDCILIPIIPSSFGIYGMERLINHIEEIEKYASEGRNIIKKIVINQIDNRKLITKDVDRFLSIAYKELVLNSTIRTDSNIDNCQWENKVLGEYKPKSRAQQDFLKLSSEIINIFEGGKEDDKRKR